MKATRTGIPTSFSFGPTNTKGCLGPRCRRLSTLLTILLLSVSCGSSTDNNIVDTEFDSSSTSPSPDKDPAGLALFNTYSMGSIEQNPFEHNQAEGLAGPSTSVNIVHSAQAESINSAIPFVTNPDSEIGSNSEQLEALEIPTTDNSADQTTSLDSQMPERPLLGASEATLSDSYRMGRTFSNWYVGNTQIGNFWDNKPAYPFIADTSSEITSIIVYWVWAWNGKGGGDYSAGDGGVIQLDIVDDNGGIPGTNTIATTTLVAGIDSINKTSNLAKAGKHGGPATHGMSPIKPTIAGKTYWVTFKNIHPDPKNNFLSVNGLGGRVVGGLETPAGWEGSQGAPDEIEGRTLAIRNSYLSSDIGEIIIEDRSHMGIYQINYNDGTSEGFGIVGGRDEMQRRNKITHTNWIRQKITPLRDNKILDAHISVARLRGSGNLVMTVTDELGTVLATDSRSVLAFRQQSSDPAGTNGDTAGLPFNHRWEEFNEINGFTMLAGYTYFVTLHTDDPETEVNSYGGQLGNYSGYGFAANTLGHQGNSAEVSADSGRNWGYWHYNNTSRTIDVELPIFFNKRSQKK